MIKDLYQFLLDYIRGIAKGIPSDPSAFEGLADVLALRLLLSFPSLPKGFLGVVISVILWAHVEVLQLHLEFFPPIFVLDQVEPLSRL